MKILNLVLMFAIFISTALPIAFATSGPVGGLTATVLHPAAVVTADGLTNSVDIKNYEGTIAILLNVATTGSSQKTIAFKVQHATTSGGSYADVTGGGFTTVSDAASHQIIYLNKDTLRRYIKLDVNVTTGDSISAAVAASILGLKKYR